MTSQNRYFIIGTDTDVGKTVLSLILMRFFYSKGLTPFYLKPFQTGCRDPYDSDSDAAFIYRHIEQLKGKDPAESVIYCFKNPKAPFFAARDEGKENDIHIDRIREVINEKALYFNPIIIEAAGGLLLPVNKNTLMIDMIEITGARPVVAARAGLGTINHTLLTLEALKLRGIRPLGVIFLDSGKTPTPKDMIIENREAIEEQSGIKVACVIDRLSDFSCHGPANCLDLEDMF